MDCTSWLDSPVAILVIGWVVVTLISRVMQQRAKQRANEAQRQAGATLPDAGSGAGTREGGLGEQQGRAVPSRSEASQAEMPELPEAARRFFEALGVELPPEMTRPAGGSQPAREQQDGRSSRDQATAHRAEDLSARQREIRPDVRPDARPEMEAEIREAEEGSTYEAGFEHEAELEAEDQPSRGAQQSPPVATPRASELQVPSLAQAAADELTAMLAASWEETGEVDERDAEHVRRWRPRHMSLGLRQQTAASESVPLLMRDALVMQAILKPRRFPAPHGVGRRRR